MIPKPHPTAPGLLPSNIHLSREVSASQDTCKEAEDVRSSISPLFVPSRALITPKSDLLDSQLRVNSEVCVILQSWPPESDTDVYRMLLRITAHPASSRGQCTIARLPSPCPYHCYPTALATLPALPIAFSSSWKASRVCPAFMVGRMHCHH